MTNNQSKSTLCQCIEPEIYVEGRTTKYYACKKCEFPIDFVKSGNKINIYEKKQIKEELLKAQNRGR